MQPSASPDYDARKRVGRSPDAGVPSDLVVQLVPWDLAGGVETAARSIAEAEYLTCNFRLYFMWGRTLASQTERVIDHPKDRESPASYLRTIMDLRKLRPKVLICSLWRSALVGIAVKLLRPSTRLVIFLHNTRAEHPIDALMHRLAFVIADQVWADSAATLNKRVGSARRSTRVISFVTTHKTYTGERVASPRFVTWGRIHWQKGLDRSLALIAALGNRGISASFVIYGSNKGARSDLEQMAARLAVSERIQFAGHVPHDALSDITENYAFFLQLSRYEGMGMAVIEAMQLGLVPVVTAVGEIARYVTDGVNGIIVDPDNLGEAARRVEELLGRPDRFAEMSRQAAATWAGAPLYREDVCNAAMELLPIQAKGREQCAGR